MRKLALCVGAALIVLGSVESADAQYRYRQGYYGGWGRYPYAYRGSGWRGGAVAAGLVGGLVLGGLAAAAATPPYAYGYPAPYSGGYPAPSYPSYYGYPAAPYSGPAVVYSADPYAAYNEVQGGYRTVYRQGYGRVVVGAPPF